jgi:hypothetical protein
MAAEGIGPTPGEYIRHHLVHMTNEKQKSIVDFSVINIDSVIVSSLLGALICYVLWRAARKAHAGVPGRFQAAVEMLAFPDLEAPMRERFLAVVREEVSSMSTRIMRWFVRPFGGRAFLRFVFWLEGVFPKFFAENGQYPLIVVKKK